MSGLCAKRAARALCGISVCLWQKRTTQSTGRMSALSSLTVLSAVPGNGTPACSSALLHKEALLTAHNLLGCGT